MRLRLVLAMVVLGLVPLGSVAGGPIQFVIEQVPGTEGIGGFIFAPAIEGSVVALRAEVHEGGVVDSTIYRVELGVPTVIAARRAGQGSFGAPVIGGGNVAFWRNVVPEGIFIQSGGSFATVYDTDTPVPGGTGNFGPAGDGWPAPVPFAYGDQVAFGARDANDDFGVYRWHSFTGLQLVANKATLAPGGSEPFTGFAAPPRFSGDRVVFAAITASGSGVYVKGAGPLELVADTATTLPIGVVPFLFSSPHGDFTRIGFVVLTTSFEPEGYIFDGSFSRLFDDAPFEVGDIVDMDFGSILATDAAQNALWTDLTGSWRRVVGVGDALDGGVVTDLRFSNQALSGDTIVFMLEVDGTEGVYRATAAEAARLPAWAVAALGGLAALVLVLYPLRSKSV